MWGNERTFGMEKKNIFEFFDNGFHGFMVLFEILKTLYLNLYYLGNLCKTFLTRNGFEDFENIVDI